MLDEDDVTTEPGVIDLAMRGWRTLDEHPLDVQAKRVQLEHNNLQALPKGIGNLTFMLKLDVSHNMLESIPKAIGKCTRLRILYIDHNRLEELPKEMGNLFFLEELNAEHNRLVTIPSTLGKLVALSSIRLKTNKLETLPYEIGGLETLEVLDCSDNDKLHMVPEELRDDSEMVKFVIRLHFDTMGHINRIKNEYVELQEKLQYQDQSNLRLRDAIDSCKREKDSIIKSLIPGSGMASMACTLM